MNYYQTLWYIFRWCILSVINRCFATQIWEKVWKRLRLSSIWQTTLVFHFHERGFSISPLKLPSTEIETANKARNRFRFETKPKTSLKSAFVLKRNGKQAFFLLSTQVENTFHTSFSFRLLRIWVSSVVCHFVYKWWESELFYYERRYSSVPF